MFNSSDTIDEMFNDKRVEHQDNTGILDIPDIPDMVVSKSVLYQNIKV